MKKINIKEELTKDNLSELFELQTEFMRLLGINEQLSLREQHMKMRDMMNAITQECAEVLDEKQGGIQWKPWRKWVEPKDTTTYNNHVHYVTEELIDIFHFLLEAMILWNITPEILYEEYKKKMKVNIERQKEGY